MKIAIVGSRNIVLQNLGEYIPEGVSEIVSGGAKGVDCIAREYAITNGIKLTEFLPDYSRFGRAAPLKRNDTIVEYSDLVLIFWDGKSKGSKYVIDRCKKTDRPYKIHLIEK
ncbi:MAG: DUF2493 domain-containing protein [Ruminococcaceae bacterium]|nr:DUF2493 domain-containing protein [Oscillospiraceae bacterium]